MKKYYGSPKNKGFGKNSTKRSLKLKFRQMAIFAVLLLSLAWPCTAAAREPDNQDSSSLIKSLEIIRSVITRADSQRCPMAPSCSAYARQAFQRHGALLGWIMTCDRLMRCGRDELRLGSKIRISGRIYTHDPLENNDFWWHKHAVDR